jgi:hypothetical protein
MAGCLVPAACVALFVGVMATDDPKAGMAQFWMVFAGVLACAAVVGVAPGMFGLDPAELVATDASWYRILVRIAAGVRGDGRRPASAGAEGRVRAAWPPAQDASLSQRRPLGPTQSLMRVKTWS